MGIDTELITGIAGELQSFAGLSKKIKDVDKALGDRIHAVERNKPTIESSAPSRWR